VIAWLKRPRQMTTARFWRKWLRLGEWWLRRVRIKRVNSQPIAFRQHRLRVRQPDEATLVPCVAAKPASRWSRPDIKHTSVYLSEAAYEALRRVAFDERRKPHDLLMEGVELTLKKRGYPALADLKAK